MNKKSLIDKKFGKLTVIQESGRNHRNEVLWLCNCECDNQHIVKTRNLVTGKTKSCGCIGTGPLRKDDLIGKRFGKLVVLNYSHSDKNRCALYNCKCDCGNTRPVRARSLRIGMAVTCGCKKSYKEITGTIFGRMISNCKRRTRTLSCSITIIDLYDLWIKQDRKCAISGLPLEIAKNSTASIDRIDPSKGYIEGNVQWVHRTINRMKWDMNQQDFVKWCKMVASA